LFAAAIGPLFTLVAVLQPDSNLSEQWLIAGFLVQCASVVLAVVFITLPPNTALLPDALGLRLRRAHRAAKRER
jgi:hypothetical protein